jgi:hypothetical protein
VTWLLAAAVAWALLLGGILYGHWQTMRRRDELEALVRATMERHPSGRQRKQRCDCGNYWLLLPGEVWVDRDADWAHSWAMCAPAGEMLP